MMPSHDTMIKRCMNIFNERRFFTESSHNSCRALSGIIGTFMISFVKGKTEIFLDLSD